MKKLKHKTGLLQPLIVYSGNTRVGQGYLIVYPDYQLGAPNLVQDNGEPLKADFYQVLPTDEMKLVYIHETVQ